MKKHTKIYYKEMAIHPSEWVACEWCGKTANSIHHLDNRGMGGSATKDYIENLAALCMPCHRDVEDHKIDNDELRQKHLKNIP